MVFRFLVIKALHNKQKDLAYAAVTEETFAPLSHYIDPGHLCQPCASRPLLGL